MLRASSAISADRRANSGRQNARLLALFAGQAASAVQNTRLLAEAARRGERVRRVDETARDLATAQELAALLQTIVDRAAGLLHVATAAMHLYDASQDELELVVAHGLPSVLGTRAKLGEGMAGRAAQNREAIIVDNYQTWEYRSPKYANIPFRAMLELPMLHNGELIGVLAVHEVGEGTRKFTEEDACLLSLFAGQAAAAVSNARLLAETRTRAQQLGLLYEAGLAERRARAPSAASNSCPSIAVKALHADRAEFFQPRCHSAGQWFSSWA